MIIEIEAQYQSDAGTTKDTPYLALTGELWGVFCEYLWENQPRYNGTALYIESQRNRTSLTVEIFNTVTDSSSRQFLPELKVSEIVFSLLSEFAKLALTVIFSNHQFQLLLSRTRPSDFSRICFCLSLRISRKRGLCHQFLQTMWRKHWRLSQRPVYHPCARRDDMLLAQLDRMHEINSKKQDENVDNFKKSFVLDWTNDAPHIHTANSSRHVSESRNDD